MDDTYEQYEFILNNVSTESWNLTRLDKTCIPADPTNNPIRQLLPKFELVNAIACR